VETIRRWQESDPSGRASLRAGQILSHHEQYETALPYLREAAAHAPYLYDARLAQANAEFHLGHYDAVLQLLNQLTPPADDPEYQLLRAATLDKLDRFDEALEAYRRAIRSQPRREVTYLELGLFFVNHLAYDAALENDRAAQKVLPQSLNLALAEAITLNLAGRREESYTKLREIEGRWPEQDLPYILAGISAYTAYRYDAARAEFEKAAALESSNPLAYYYLALLDSESPQSDTAEPLRWARMAVEGDPSFALAHMLLGKLYRRQGKLEEARKSLEEAVRLQPNLADAHYLLGRTYAELGDPARAEMETRESERWHREVHQVSPEKQSVLHLLVQVEPAR
jgi:tetratricopeptide (TPR) repeat protein